MVDHDHGGGRGLTPASGRIDAGPLVVEVLAPGFVGTGFPRAVAGSTKAASPKPGDIGGEESYRLFRLLDRLRESFGRQIEVHLIEPLSFAWMLRVIRYRPRHYPVFVVGGREVVAGLDEAAVARTVAAFLHSAAPG